MAFAGAYRWTTIPICAGVVVLAVLARPSIGRRRDVVLDAALLLCLAATAAQLIPLQPSTRDRLSPEAFAVDRVDAIGPEPSVRPAHPLSVDVESTGWALALGAAYIGLFWCARAIFAGGGIRSTVRGVSWLGLMLTTLVAVQRATAPSLLYWTWKPLSVGASPYGPFVNRNNLATWLAMAIPLTVGYAVARYQSRQRDGSATLSGSFDATQLSLAGSAVLMTAGLLASLSRAGTLGAGAGLALFVVLSGRRIRGAAGRLWIGAALALMVVAASLYGNIGGLLLRMQSTTEQGEWGRPVIWRDTWRMAQDFRLTGIGAGAFEHAMLQYQQGSRLFFFNHAHNEYLQILAEGGLLVAVPAALALLAAIGLMATYASRDRTSMFSVRAGAIAGLFAVAVQSVWDTGLRMPANGVLFAVVAAIALHEPRQASTGAGTRGRT